MRRALIPRHYKTSLIIVLLALRSSQAFAYRPFVSTDAAVVDLKEMEIELGYFNWKRANRTTSFIIPQTVFNYGLLRNTELVAEFGVEEPLHGSVALVDPALALKAVLREGVLQEKDGLSVAVEAGPLLPSTNREEKGFGFEARGILSGRMERLTYHVNFGGGIDRVRANPFALWGLILECPVTDKFRFVGEVNGESFRGNAPNNSALFGFIWNSPISDLSFDAGIRRGISSASPNWMFTAGLTFTYH